MDTLKIKDTGILVHAKGRSKAGKKWRIEVAGELKRLISGVNLDRNKRTEFVLIKLIQSPTCAYAQKQNIYIYRQGFAPLPRTKQPKYMQGLELGADLEVDIITYPVSLVHGMWFLTCKAKEWQYHDLWNLDYR